MKFNSTSVYIELRPRTFSDYPKVWNGEVEVDIIMDKKNKLDEPSKGDLMHLGQMVAASLGLMEEDKHLVVRLEDYIQKRFEEVREKETVKKDNVIYFNFKKEKELI